MGATILLRKNMMPSLLKQLIRDFPQFAFVASEGFCWSPKEYQILYNADQLTSRSGPWTLLHELGHAILDHKTYASDIELLQLETSAWTQARISGTTYGYEISDDYIQDCIDTYRDWIHQRSACPKCQTRSFQRSVDSYQCFNCQHIWKVSSSKFCRPYRRSEKQKTSPSAKKAMFI